MKTRWIARAAGLLVTLVIGAALFGCGKKTVINPVPNEKPTIDLTVAPVDHADTAQYSFTLSWSGYDPDGRVDHFEYAIDPPSLAGSDTAWVPTRQNSVQLDTLFQSTFPVLGGNPTRVKSISPHTFVIRAVDDKGAHSVPKWRSFYSYTIAPVVTITNPQPNDFLERQVTPSVRIQWQGQDVDGVHHTKPVVYKFKLLANGNPDIPISAIVTNPDTLRRFYGVNGYAAWDSVGGDTTLYQFTNLTPGSDYLFCIVGRDEDGAYSPVFTLTSNVLHFQVGFANTLGPTISAFNQYFFYTMPSGGFTPGVPTTWVELEVPAAQPATFNWFAEPPSGADIEWYRWRLDGDVDDETPRSNESTDWYHWSQRSIGTTSCTVGPFASSGEHWLYIEAQDNNGLLSVLVIHFHPVVPTFERELLVVDDTRLEVDQDNGSGGYAPYGKEYPSRAELDTLLFAKGGFPWRKPQRATPPPYSKLGLLTPYHPDTIGTRQGYEIMTTSVPFSLLAKYRHVIWMDDKYAGINGGDPTNPNDPLSLLHYMSRPGVMNTLGIFAFSGGEVWGLGGQFALCTLIEYNAKGTKNNDTRYGTGQTVFSNAEGELIPGRMMYDAAHWTSEMVIQPSTVGIIRDPNIVTRDAGLYPDTTFVKFWYDRGWNYRGDRNTGNRYHHPHFSLLPARMRGRKATLGDSLPPTRLSTQSATYFPPGSATVTGAIPIEYLTQPNYVVEDGNPDPSVVTEYSTLDTLMRLNGAGLATDVTGAQPVIMTYYHGVQAPSFVFTGFPVWAYSVADVKPLIDFVLQELWGLTPSAAPVARTQQVASRATAPGLVQGGPKAGTTSAPVRSRMPVARGAGR